MTTVQVPRTAWNKGKTGLQHHSLETRTKISSKLKGMKRSPETRAKMSKAVAEVWRSGKRPRFRSIETRAKVSRSLIGRPVSAETRHKMSLARMGWKPSIETRVKMSMLRKGKSRKALSSETKARISRATKGKKRSFVTRLSLSRIIKEKWQDPNYREKMVQHLRSIRKCGPLHHAWKGGISHKPYPPQFTRRLRDSIRKRDQYRCQWCGTAQSELQRRLHVHHRDSNKENNNLDNLISLCYSCHHKKDVQAYFYRTLPIISN